ALVAGAAFATIGGGSKPPITGGTTPATARSARGHSGTLARGKAVKAQTFTRAPLPTERQKEALGETFEDRNVPAPNRVTRNSDPTPGPAVPAPNNVGAADTDYKRFLIRPLPTGSIIGGSGYSSFVNEPSVAASGNRLFMTGNWYAALSKTRG